jgi:hypothetical protein
MADLFFFDGIYSKRNVRIFHQSGKLPPLRKAAERWYQVKNFNK